MSGETLLLIMRRVATMLVTTSRMMAADRMRMRPGRRAVRGDMDDVGDDEKMAMGEEDVSRKERWRCMAGSDAAADAGVSSMWPMGA